MQIESDVVEQKIQISTPEKARRVTRRHRYVPRPLLTEADNSDEENKVRIKNII